MKINSTKYIPMTRKRFEVFSAPELAGYILAISGLLFVCVSLILSGAEIPISKPAILLVGAGLIIVPCRNIASLKILQQVAAFYLLLVPVVQSSTVSLIRTPVAGSQLKLSVDAVFLLICAAGFLAGRIRPRKINQNKELPEIMTGWILLFVIIICHMLFLSVLLSRFYGYGAERDVAVLGKLSLCFLLFVFLGDKLKTGLFLRLTGLILTGFYTVLFVRSL